MKNVRGLHSRRPTPTGLLAMGAACAVLAACGSTTVPTPGHGSTVSGFPHTPASAPARAVEHASAATNKARTQAETDRLIGIAAVPAGATRLAAAPEVLSGPAIGAPVSASRVDASRFWRVPMTLQQSQTWIATHAPGGLPSDGSYDSTSGSATTSIGDSFTDDRQSSAWEDAELSIGVVPDGARGSVWRVDGVALWLDPTPETAPPGGMRLAVTVSDGCPESDRGAANVPAGPTDALLPPGTPTAGLICVYNGSNGAAFALHAEARMDATRAGRLALKAGAIALTHTDGDIQTCPSDDGEEIVVAFAYPGGGHAALWVHDTGCRTVSNGSIDAVRYPAVFPFVSAVRALLPH